MSGRPTAQMARPAWTQSHPKPVTSSRGKQARQARKKKDKTYSLVAVLPSYASLVACSGTTTHVPREPGFRSDPMYVRAHPTLYDDSPSDVHVELRLKALLVELC
jgi:hypothetical protein